MSSRRLSVSLRIAVVQLNPQIGQVSSNVSRAWSLIHRLKETTHGKPPDLVVFPEFALTGYNYHSRDHILPYATAQNDGQSFRMAQEVSRLFNCYTVIGYPERSDNSTEARLYNSAAVTGPTGDLVFNYRKSFLYYTDDGWGCHENPQGFQTFPLDFKQRATDSNGKLQDITLKTSIGICMDLSPYKFTAPFHDYEFATYNVDQGTELIICPMAWLHSSSVTKDAGSATQEKLRAIQEATAAQGIPIHGSQGHYQFDLDNSHKTRPVSRDLSGSYSDLEAPDMSNVNYWILRFLPFLALRQRRSWLWRLQNIAQKSYMGATSTRPWLFEGKNAVVVFANRCGIEDANTVFAGSSGVIKFNGSLADQESEIDSTNKSVELLGNLGKGPEGVLMRDVEFEVAR